MTPAQREARIRKLLAQIDLMIHAVELCIDEVRQSQREVDNPAVRRQRLHAVK